ncbi:MAG: hypothetical protein ABW206_02170, partial [Agrobacterium vaccinii]
ETPADSATADTAFKNLEPAFIFNSYLFPLSLSGRNPTPAICVVLPAFPLQASPTVNFCLLRKQPWLNRHFGFKTR